MIIAIFITAVACATMAWLALKDWKAALFMALVGGLAAAVLFWIAAL